MAEISLRSLLRRMPGLTRGADWWSHKVPLVLALAYTVLLGRGPEPVISVGQAWWSLVAFLAAIVGVAGIGHVVNDLFDADQDRAVGRLRPAAEAGPRTRLALFALLGVAAFVPWLYLPSDALVWGLLTLELALLVGYSSPPLRAKERGTLALVFDASYAYTVPLVLTLVTFAGLPVGNTDDLPRIAGVVVVWSLATGLRSIAFHQISDLEQDAAADVDTWAVRAGRDRAVRLLAPVIAVEAVSFISIIVVLSDRIPLVAPLVLGALAYRGFQLRVLAGIDSAVEDHRGLEHRLHRLAFDYLNDLYERWLPVIILGTLVARAPVFWPLLAAHLILFDSGPRQVLLRDVRSIGSTSYTVPFMTTYWLIRIRVRRSARGNEPAFQSTIGPGRGRWVYVVCGPEEHLRTLHTSLERLRPLTDQEILVVTDSTRNEIEIDHDLIIDVQAPTDLDDKGASIWLKTSIHRYVPLDRTACYLDSDVIAVAPPDGIFDHWHQPITFARDLPVADNNIDRFSPWAMNCECTGVDESSSCHHLREALKDFADVHVPSEFVPWNGGVFLFDESSMSFLDAWHANVLQAFDDDRFQTRDQHALVATVWQRGIQDQPFLPGRFNMILDLGNNDITWHGGHRYATDPDDEPTDAIFLHLYANALDDPDFELERDVHEVLLRQMTHRRMAERHTIRANMVKRGITRSGRSRTPIRKTVAGIVKVGVDGIAGGVRSSLDRVLWPVVNITRRGGRSVGRRIRVLVGREDSPGGRLDAVRMPKGWAEQPLNSNEVGDYYDDWNDRYLARFGPVLQTLRSQEPDDLVVELGRRAELDSGQVICDAGCGVGGPAMVLAREFEVTVEGVTVSGEQARVARGLIDAAGLQGRVDVRQGDFHRLERLYAPERFDAVIFMEAFCHTDHPRVVLESVWRVLKPGGTLLIKDLFRAPGSSRDERKLISIAARNTERHCRLQVRPRDMVTEAITAVGFAIEIDEELELEPEYEYDTAATFMLENGIDIFEGQSSTYLAHAVIRARKPVVTDDDSCLP